MMKKKDPKCKIEARIKHVCEISRKKSLIFGSKIQ